MNDLTYDIVNSRLDQLWLIYLDLINDNKENEYKKIHPDEFEIDELRLCLEIDTFVKEYPIKFEKYLKPLQKKYECLHAAFIEYFAQYKENLNPDAKDFPSPLVQLDFKISKIRKHLNGLLVPKNKVQEQPKLITPPKGKTKLTRTQTSLLFWYLRERCLIAQPSNTTLAIAIELITGHQANQIQDILKMPDTSVYGLGKGNDKVNSNDFATIISELKTLISRIEKEYKNHPDKEE